MFNEQLSITQTGYVFAYCSNPLNPDFIYIGYVTATNKAIRVVKLYRHNKQSTVGTYIYLVMWATREHAIAFGSTTTSLRLVVDRCGAVYIQEKYGTTNTIRLWKIIETSLDLGHNAMTAITAPTTTISDMLSAIDDRYSIISAEVSVLIPGLPAVNDVIISTVTNVNDVKQITFKYINYDIFELYEDERTILKALITTALNTLYSGTGNEVVNLNTGAALDGESGQIYVQIPTASGKAPCIVKGTEILCKAAGKYLFNRVENMTVGDFVVNQHGVAVRVVMHSIDIITSKKHNSPYIIPPHYFEKNKPYKQLLISGDHGILVHNKMIFPRDMGLRQIPFNYTIEYHHLQLANDTANCYIANGVEVDSLHPGPYLHY